MQAAVCSIAWRRYCYVASGCQRVRAACQRGKQQAALFRCVPLLRCARALWSACPRLSSVLLALCPRDLKMAGTAEVKSEQPCPEQHCPAPGKEPKEAIKAMGAGLSLRNI